MSDPLLQAPRFTTRVRVRYAETDAAGVVYHADYLTYFEVARIELLRALGHPVNDIEARGVVLPVVEARVKYLRPARLDDLLDVSLEVSTVGPVSFAFDYEVTRDGLLLATGWTRHAVCERASGRAVRMPAWLRELFADELTSAVS
jgi:acyl-CoA thioester hydrolase